MKGNTRHGCEHGAEYERFVKRNIGLCQMAAEAVCVVAFVTVAMLAAVCFD